MGLENLPKLGFGLMRLPEKDGALDLEAICAMVDAYMATGMNYFDTAYIYHEGLSEKVIRDALVTRYPRETFTVATKLPAWCLNNKEDRDAIFEEQLARTGAEYFDFYLLHSLEDGNNYERHEKLDCFRWAIEKKEAGLIRHFGFSFHGSPELLETILDRHPEIEFVQIQLNYADWTNPVVRAGELYEILKKRNIPMIIMEPVKGGMLAKMEPQVEKLFRENNPEASPASWAFRFLASLPGIATILSGMSTMEQVQDNLDTFQNLRPLDREEYGIIERVTDMLLDMEQVPCTSCKYCIEGCPAHILIPEVFRALNTARLYPEDTRPHFFYGNLVERSAKASDCIACGQCESVCPQHLPIIELMKEAETVFDHREEA